MESHYVCVSVPLVTPERCLKCATSWSALLDGYQGLNFQEAH
jgi:hypothetical protein